MLEKSRTHAALLLFIYFSCAQPYPIKDLSILGRLRKKWRFRSSKVVLDLLEKLKAGHDMSYRNG
jgi:hypothetical protein